MASQATGLTDRGAGRVCRGKGSSSLPGVFLQPPANSSALSSSRPQSLPCQHPLHLAIQRHPHFLGRFNFSTPVLLSGGVFTQELWDHLSQRKAPYGWQGLSRQGNLRPLPAARPSGLSWSPLPAFGLVQARPPALTAPRCGDPMSLSRRASQLNPQAVYLPLYFPTPASIAGS